MKPGPDLDALVAEKVMGWKWQEIPQHIHVVDGGAQFEKDGKYLMPENAYFPPHDVGQGRLFYQAAAPAYSTILKDVWQVVDKMQTVFEHFNVDFNCGMYTVKMPNGIVAQETSFPYAMCKAALGATEKGRG